MIDNVLHFVAFDDEDGGGVPFSFVHFMAIWSALRVNAPDAVYVHCRQPPRGEYWERVRPYVTAVPAEPPREVFGRRVRDIAHQVDVLRLRTLIEHGGIYLDLDTISVRPLRELLRHACVLGVEADTRDVRRRIGLCNAVILAERGAPFLRRWYDHYRTFDDRHWNMHSVVLPELLSRFHPGEVHVEPYDRFHWPLHDRAGLARLFERNERFPSSLVHHLWQRLSWNAYLRHLDDDIVRRHDTTYNVIARRFL